VRDYHLTEGNESILRTFRLESDVIKGLDEEANKQGATVNGIACKILRKHVRIGTKLEHFGLITLTKEDMLDIVSSMNDDLIMEVATKIGSTLPKEVILQLYGDDSLENFRQYLEKILCGYQGWASYSSEEKGGKLEIRLGHTLGQKWTLFLSSYIDAAHASITGKKADFKYRSSYSIIFTINPADVGATSG
jgi:hypothetical protein